MKLLILLLLASVASSEEKTESKIGFKYDLFYSACDCRESA